MQLKAETSVGLFVLTAIGVLIYMSFQIGSLRFATYQYARYCLYSHDISGLNKKADVRIAGVKVGWIDQTIFEEDCQRVRICVMLLKEYHLYADAYGTIRQNGILGGKYLEIIPGDPRLQKLPENSTLAGCAEDLISMDILFKKMNNIASHVESVTEALQSSIGGEDGAVAIKRIVDGCADVTEKVASCAESIDRLITTNEGVIYDIVSDFKVTVQEIKDAIPDVQNKIGQISNAFESLTPSLSKVLDSYDKNKGLVIKHKFRLF